MTDDQSTFWADCSVLITGVCGTVGSELLRQLSAMPCARAVGIDNNESELFFQSQHHTCHKLLDWQAVLDALQSGHLAGAAMDVFEGEFEPGFADRFPEHRVLRYAREQDNLILTSHIGGSTVGAWGQTEAHTIDMVEAELSARPEARP